VGLGSNELLWLGDRWRCSGLGLGLGRGLLLWTLLFADTLSSIYY